MHVVEKVTKTKPFEYMSKTLDNKLQSNPKFMFGSKVLDPICNTQNSYLFDSFQFNPLLQCFHDLIFILYSCFLTPLISNNLHYIAALQLSVWLWSF